MPSVPEAVQADYDAAVRQLATTLAGWEDPAVLKLTPEALELPSNTRGTSNLAYSKAPNSATYATGARSWSERPHASPACSTSPLIPPEPGDDRSPGIPSPTP